MSTINVNQLVKDIQSAASAIISKDVTTLAGFSDRQVLAIGQQAALVATGIATGGITPATQQFFLDSIGTMTQNFLETLEGLLWITIEKIWNAAVNVIWGAINGVLTGAGLVALPIPVKV